MNYHNITHDDMLNGDGLRVVLWVAGCNHHCEGCQNPITWNEAGGIPFDDTAKAELYDYLGRDYIDGITFSGGDPLFPGNRDAVLNLAMSIKHDFVNKSVWIYTGYNWEDVKDLPVMRYTDVLVDGEYMQSLRDTSAHWVGSTNQRIIDVYESLHKGEVVLKE